jgi:hypothetical protein
VRSAQQFFQNLAGFLGYVTVMENGAGCESPGSNPSVTKFSAKVINRGGESISIRERGRIR